MGLRKCRYGVMQILTILYIYHHRQESLLHIFDLWTLLKPTYLVADSASYGLIDRTVTHLLFDIVHKRCKKLINILLHHRPHCLSIYLSRINKIIGIDGWSYTTVKVGKYLLELQQFHCLIVCYVICLE
jgi:hypothetical protein